ncbi:hypothetical protein ACJX0J_033896, partial [Zea mays]
FSMHMRASYLYNCDMFLILFSLNAHRYAKEILQKEMHTILGISEVHFLILFSSATIAFQELIFNLLSKQKLFIPFKLIYKVASEIRPADFVPFRIPVDHL